MTRSDLSADDHDRADAIRHSCGAAVRRGEIWPRRRVRVLTATAAGGGAAWLLTEWDVWSERRETARLIDWGVWPLTSPVPGSLSGLARAAVPDLIGLHGMPDLDAAGLGDTVWHVETVSGWAAAVVDAMLATRRTVTVGIDAARAVVHMRLLSGDVRIPRDADPEFLASLAGERPVEYPVNDRPDLKARRWEAVREDATAFHLLAYSLGMARMPQCGEGQS